MLDFLQNLAYFLVIFALISIILDFSLRARGYIGPRSDHFDGKRFYNIRRDEPRPERKTSILVLFYFFIGKHFDSIRWKKRPLSHGEAVVPAKVDGKEIVATFINHSTVLLQTEGLNIITDPIWAAHAGPWGIFGPGRYSPPGMSIEALPKIDIILLSHNHYDHMDLHALKKIWERDHPTIYTTLGNSRHLTSRGIVGAHDMDWGDRLVHSEEISIGCVPAQHFSARALSDHNRTLWAGFVISTPHGDIYFAGDTGYGPFADHVKRLYPDGFRFALLPIGAFEPRNFMHSAHMGPDDAIFLYKDLKVEEAVAIHFGTFDLAFDAQDDPPDQLAILLQDPENRDVKFHALENGQSLKIS